jgi:hypothetical protein
VTKQNFRSRHLHADLDPNHNNKIGKLVRKRSDDENTSCDSVSSSEQPATKQTKFTTQNVEDSSQSRLAHWETLLEERPEGLEKMDIWIGRVLSTSDPKVLLPNKMQTKKDSESDSRKLRWNDLLKERPGADASKDDVNSWLTQMLQVSAVSQEIHDEESEEQDDSSSKED